MYQEKSRLMKKVRSAANALIPHEQRHPDISSALDDLADAIATVEQGENAIVLHYEVQDIHGNDEFFEDVTRALDYAQKLSMDYQKDEDYSVRVYARIDRTEYNGGAKSHDHK